MNVAQPKAKKRYRSVRVHIQRARCPFCSSRVLYTYRSDKNDDGTQTRKTRCLDCKRTFHVIVE